MVFANIVDIIVDPSIPFLAAVCVAELSVFLACMKKSDFVESFCEKEFKEFSECVQREREALKAFKEANQQGLLGTEGRLLTAKQVDKLMEMWPQSSAPRKGRLKGAVLPHMPYSDPLLVKKRKL